MGREFDKLWLSTLCPKCKEITLTFARKCGKCGEYKKGALNVESVPIMERVGEINGRV